jgi:hypothetical protein
MPRFSKSQIDKLGEQLRKQDLLEEESLRQLQQVRAEYSSPLTQAESALRNELGLRPTSRIKTINTIIEKLKREKTRLSRMQDSQPWLPCGARHRLSRRASSRGADPDQSPASMGRSF